MDQSFISVGIRALGIIVVMLAATILPAVIAAIVVRVVYRRDGATNAAGHGSDGAPLAIPITMAPGGDSRPPAR